MTVKISDKDLQLMHEAIGQGVLTQVAAAKQLGVSVPTLRRRFKKLLAGGNIARHTLSDLSLANASKLYASLSEQLHAVLQRMKQTNVDDNDPAASKSTTDLIRLHAKSLMALVAAERSIAKANETHKESNAAHNDESTDATTTVMDLQLARDEVHRRLARLRATDADTTPEPAGQPEP